MALRYIEEEEPGYSRERRGRGFCFRDDQGRLVTDRQKIARLKSVGLPPAYTDSWYCREGNGHILAYGYDARGRKQYRYHPDFRAAQDDRKFELCKAFGEALPKIRERVTRDLGSRNLTRDRAVASIIRLLDTGGIRIGNEAYEKANRSYGATTLKMRHVDLAGDRLKLRFKAKSGQLCEMAVTDRGLARFVRNMQDLPGQNLFQYESGDGFEAITSSDVNDYIRETMGEEYSAKHFRTWAASARAFAWLHDHRGDKLPLKDMLATVSDALGNTPAIARSSYIHPALIDAAETPSVIAKVPLPRRTAYLDRYERGLLEFLGKV